MLAPKALLDALSDQASRLFSGDTAQPRAELESQFKVLMQGAFSKLDLVSRVVSMTPWTTPAPIGASWAANWSFSPVILCLICMATAMVMYLPFLKAYEKQLLAQERENAVGQADNAAQTA